MNDDTISRKQAIDALMSLTIYKSKREIVQAADKDENSWIGGVAECIDEIEDLPSAQPEPCEDAVSRKAVKDGFVEMCNLICPYTEKQRHTMCGSCLLGTAFDVLEATQPVTPKQRTGKWINGKCDKCGEHAPFYAMASTYHESNFCPHCGAKMEGVAE